MTLLYDPNSMLDVIIYGCAYSALRSAMLKFSFWFFVLSYIVMVLFCRFAIPPMTAKELDSIKGSDTALGYGVDFLGTLLILLLGAHHCGGP